MSEVYVFLADGFEEIEGLTVVDLLRRAGIPVSTVSVTGSLRVTGSHQITVEADLLFENADFKNSALLVLPGGMPGTKHLKEHSGLAALLKKTAAADQRIAAICAGPSIPGSMGLLNGHKAVCYPGFENELEGAYVSDNPVEISGNFTTSRGLGTAIPFALSLISQLKSQEDADRIAASIIYSSKPTREES